MPSPFCWKGPATGAGPRKPMRTPPAHWRRCSTVWRWRWNRPVPSSPDTGSAWRTTGNAGKRRNRSCATGTTNRRCTIPRSLAVTWETSFEQLSPGAQALLDVLSWFAPEPIPRDTFAVAFKPTMLRDLTDGADPPPEAEDLLAELESLSLLTWETGNSAFSVHRLVQEVAQARLEADERSITLAVALGLIDNAVPYEPPANDVPRMAGHRTFAASYRVSRRRRRQGRRGRTHHAAAERTGLYLNAKGLVIEAEPLMRRALAIDEASFAASIPTSPFDSTTSRHCLKTTNWLAEAEPLSRRNLEILHSIYGTHRASTSQPGSCVS